MKHYELIMKLLVCWKLTIIVYICYYTNKHICFQTTCRRYFCEIKYIYIPENNFKYLLFKFTKTFKNRLKHFFEVNNDFLKINDSIKTFIF